jgi:hypothetical protein
MKKNQIRFLIKEEKSFLKKIFPLSVYKENRQYFRFAETSGDNHPKHFRKLIMCHVHWYYENTDLELFVQKC